MLQYIYNDENIVVRIILKGNCSPSENMYLLNSFKWDFGFN